MSKKKKFFSDRENIKRYMQQLLEDVEALEIMLEKGLLEKGVTRIGAEQELYIIDNDCRPKPIATELMNELDDDNFTYELAQYNLEINLDPQVFQNGCLKKMEQQLSDKLSIVRNLAAKKGALPVLTGILPTIRKRDIDLENLVKDERYLLLCKILNELTDSEYNLYISGVDEFSDTHDSPMFESCNTSFQIHYQVDPDMVVNLYNYSLLISAPLVASAVNSPFLMGKQLWKETRIALFEQAVDTRNREQNPRDITARVFFGNYWLKNSVIELYQDNIARFKAIVGADFNENSIEAIESGNVPGLHALDLFNGTIWSWNRVCYGISEGKPHLRIENRVLPSGPTLRDEIANAAFWFGMMKGMPDRYSDIPELVDIDQAKENFLKAAQYGLDTKMMWLDNKPVSTQELIIDELLPVAENGLRSADIDRDDVELYLGIIKERVGSGKNGANWLIKSFQNLKKEMSRESALYSITSALVKNQQGDQPVHTWEYLTYEDNRWTGGRLYTVSQFMSTDLFVLREDDIIDLATDLMHWKHIRHVPVEDDSGNLVGIITSTELLDHYSKKIKENSTNILVKDLMTADLITVEPETPVASAIELMKDREVGCLLVVTDNKLVGIMTERDLLSLYTTLLN